MYRTHTCGELRSANIGQEVTLSGWIQRVRNLGGMTFIDLRDRYGITQLVADEKTDKDLESIIHQLGREYVIKCEGVVVERSSKNPKISTGDIEVKISCINILNQAEIPPFTIEEETDGGDELRMKYRYLDIRRNPVKNALILRHRIAQEVRKYLDSQNFIEVETPFLIKSTPEGARDFVVPSRMNPGEFYALPQSPQTFKQLLMVSGLDKYFQLVKCFRDEDLRADRQPEFTQIDCEMSFVEQDDVLKAFEGMMVNLFSKIVNLKLQQPFQRLSFSDAMSLYGSDKPDLRFDMKIQELTSIVKGKGFVVFDSSEYIGGIVVEGCSEYSRKQLDELTKFVQKPQIGAKGLVYVKLGEPVKSSVDKFFSSDDLMAWANHLSAKKGDLVLILAGDRNQTLEALGALRLEMGERLNLRPKDVFAPLWVVDFPLLEWDEDSGILRKMRSKETEADYRYFHEPDLLPIRIDETWLSEILSCLPELPAERRERFIHQYGLPEYDADILTNERSLSEYFEETVNIYQGDPKRISNWIINDVLRILNELGIQVGALKLTPTYLAEIIKLIDKGSITTSTGKSLLEKVQRTGDNPNKIVQEEGLALVSDQEAIQKVCKEIISQYPDQVAIYKKGKTTLIGWFVGQVMQKMRGKADPQLARKILEDLLK